MLVGIVKKNAIMMIDFAIETQRANGRNPADAIYEACLVRFRPIMMTTMAALMGTLADCAGPGRRSRGAQAAGTCGRRRTGSFAAADAVHPPVIYIYMEAARKWFATPARRAEEPTPVPRLHRPRSSKPPANSGRALAWVNPCRALWRWPTLWQT